jgi:ornithine carbamoyltransferase
MTTLALRDFLSMDDLSVAELIGLLNAADEVKRAPLSWATRLEGKQIALIFEKPSTRTRVSFEVAVASMGAHPIVLRGDELQLGRGETIEDTGRVLGGYVDAIVVRTFAQDRIERLAQAAAVPVINALSDLEHPCQCLADLQTVREQRGGLSGIVLTYIGDGNNVAHSLMLGGAKAGMQVRIAAPSGYGPLPEILDRAQELARESGGSVGVTQDPFEAAEGADVLYTDVWTSMGQEAAAAERTNALAGYQVNAALVDKAAPGVIVMHCLPAHRGEEIAADVIDGPHSVVWSQAENRLHSQKALLGWLLP